MKIFDVKRGTIKIFREYGPSLATNQRFCSSQNSEQNESRIFSSEKSGNEHGGCNQKLNIVKCETSNSHFWPSIRSR